MSAYDQGRKNISIVSNGISNNEMDLVSKPEYLDRGTLLPVYSFEFSWSFCPCDGFICLT
jgi:hypothetical protein